MPKTIKGILINVYEGYVKVVEVEKTLDEYHRILGCSCIDIVRRKIGGRSFEIVLDDEGALRARPIISAVDTYGNPALVGNLFIVKFNGEDDITSLTKQDINFINSKIKSYNDSNCFMLTCVECY